MADRLPEIGRERQALQEAQKHIKRGEADAKDVRDCVTDLQQAGSKAMGKRLGMHHLIRFSIFSLCMSSQGQVLARAVATYLVGKSQPPNFLLADFLYRVNVSRIRFDVLLGHFPAWVLIDSVMGENRESVQAQV